MFPVKKVLTSPWCIAFGAAAASVLTLTLAAQLLLRNIAAFLSSEPQLQTIFAQISTAQMSSPILLLGLVSFLYWFAVCKFCKKKVSRVFAILGGLFFLLLLWIVSVALTRVNGIRVWDVLTSLLDAAQKGWLDGI
jgi:uncharacterized membrane protein (Fun14 family)